MDGGSEKSGSLSDGELLQSSYGRNVPFEAKTFRSTTAIATRGLPSSSRVPFRGIVGNSSLELGEFVWGSSRVVSMDFTSPLL